MTVPCSSVVPCDKNEIIFGIENIIWLLFPISKYATRFRTLRTWYLSPVQQFRYREP
jgi:hypothetical protein